MISCFFATKPTGPKRCSDSSSDAAFQASFAREAARKVVIVDGWRFATMISPDISANLPNLSHVRFGRAGALNHQCFVSKG